MENFFLYIYMELSIDKVSICYSFFLSLINIVFSATGIYALRIATIPVSDMVKDQFENFIVLSLSYSISYTFLFQPALEYLEELKDAPDPMPFLDRIMFYGHFALLPLSLYLKSIWLATFLAFFISFNNHKIYRLSEIFFTSFANSLLGKVEKSNSLLYKFLHAIKEEFMTGFTIGLAKSPSDGFYSALMVLVSPLRTLCWVLLQCVFVLSFHLNSSMDSNLLSLTVILIVGYFHMLCIFPFVSGLKEVIAISSTAAYVYEQRRIIEIVCGLLATILAQYYFRIPSVPLMFAFLCLATAWLGILAHVRPHTDFAIFQFLVAASLQLAVNLFGLHFYTFLVALGVFILTWLRCKMGSSDEIILKLYTFLVALGPITLMLRSRWKMESVSVRHFRRPAV